MVSSEYEFLQQKFNPKARGCSGQSNDPQYREVEIYPHQFGTMIIIIITLITRLPLIGQSPRNPHPNFFPK